MSIVSETEGNLFCERLFDSKGQQFLLSKESIYYRLLASWTLFAWFVPIASHLTCQNLTYLSACFLLSTCRYWPSSFRLSLCSEPSGLLSFYRHAVPAFSRQALLWKNEHFQALFQRQSRLLLHFILVYLRDLWCQKSDAELEKFQAHFLFAFCSHKNCYLDIFLCSKASWQHLWLSSQSVIVLMVFP